MATMTFFGYHLYKFSKDAPMPDEVSELRLLTHLVAAGSLSEAARRWDSSPPVMSRRLAAMEARLGVRLFTRTSRHFTLTEEGALLHERALKIVADIADAEAEAAAKITSPRGKIRVGAPMQIGRRFIAPLVARFIDRYPCVGVELVLSDAGLEVVDDDLDIALRNGLPGDQSAVARQLLCSARAICATPEYLSRHGTPETPEDLLRHNCIRLVRGRRTFDRWVFQENGQRREVQVSGRLSTTSGEVMHDWVLAGKGIANKAVWDIEEDLRAGRLLQCLTSYACDEITLYMVLASRAHMPPRLRVFIDFLTAALNTAMPAKRKGPQSR